MRRRDVFAGALPLLSGTLAHADDRPPPGRRYRLGVLAAGATADSIHLQRLRAILARHGFVEGRNLEVLHRLTGGDPDRIAAAASDLVALRPDVILAVASPATRALIDRTREIPIVMLGVSEPVRSGFVESLARPGGNVTGISNNSQEITSKQAETLLEIVPQLKGVGCLWNPNNPYSDRTLSAATDFFRNSSVECILIPAASPEESATAIDQISGRVQGLIVISYGSTLASPERITLAAIRNRLAAVFSSREETAAGGLVAYGADLIAIFEKAAAYVARILLGARPAAIPVEYPTHFRLSVNLRTAIAIGVDIPPSVLARADEIID